MTLSTILVIGVQILTFAIVAAVSLILFNRFTLQSAVRRRLDEQVAPARRQEKTTLVRSEKVTNPFLLWVQKSTSIADEKDQAKLTRDLALAGITHPAASTFYVIVRFGLAIGLPLLFLMYQQISPEPTTGLPLIGGALLLCGLGLIAPRAVLDNRIAGRKLQLEQEFPDALDLMVVCVEAGLGLEAALVRVGREVHESHPRISEEYGKVTHELGAGRGRAEALRAMADRNNVESVNSFVALLIQTDTLGTSIGTTLRTYADEMRTHRYLAAEEKAMRIPVLLTVPLVACILPVIVTALMLPAIIDMVRNMGPAFGGG